MIFQMELTPEQLRNWLQYSEDKYIVVLRVDTDIKNVSMTRKNRAKEDLSPPREE